MGKIHEEMRAAAAHRDGGPAQAPKVQGQQEGTLKVICLNDVVPEDVKWLWYPYVPLGKLTLIEGDPGIGKSWLTCALAATISSGGCLPGQTTNMPPQRIMLVNSEDGLADTLAPRLRTLKADLSNVFSLEENMEHPLVLNPETLAALEAKVHEVGAITTIILDPLQAYLGEKLDMHRANEVRSVMAGLIKLAERTGCAIICVRHLRKNSGGKALYAGLGSIDFAASCRSILYVGATDQGDSCIAHSKCNLAPKGRTMKYEVRDGRFLWDGFCDVSADELAGGGTKGTDRPVDGARTWLEGYLRDGPEPAMEGMRAAMEAGHAARTVNRAKRGLVRSFQREGQWWWTLAEEPLPKNEPGSTIVCH